MTNRSYTTLVAAVVALMVATATTARGDESVSFALDIRPILSDKCFACHGPDEHAREAGLRLDVRDEAIAAGVLSAGHPDESELLRRITSDDADEIMPPPHTQKEISPAEAKLLERWIAEGAQYEVHWAYQTLVRPPVPSLDQLPGIDRSRNNSEVDAFLLRQLASQGLDYAPRADRTTLVRRLYLDLLGVPPTPAEVDRFVNDDEPAAYENLVDRLLRDVRFGERMAVYWLDLVRYADTIGYHSDTYMEVSAYRDYVIDAFNENKPFDQFTLEQLAGDLLENPSDEQLIASGYNRLLQTTEEGGAQPKEYIAIYAADRVRNVAGVWMGQTVGCAQCHDHKYDPISTRDFYSLAAFFADIKENAVGKRDPNFKLYTDEDRRRIAELRQQVDALELSSLLAADQQLADAVAAGQRRWEAELAPGDDASPSPAKAAADDDAKSQSADDAEVPENVLAAIQVTEDQRTAEQRELIAAHYRTISPELESWRKKLAAAEKRLKEYEESVRTTLITETLDQPRVTRILPRGNWLDESGDIVEPAAPEFLPHREIEGRRANRLDLAQWLVSADNPLTSRTFVNRLWKLYFGHGISRNLDDLGGQGQPPTHPQLLDWLAVEFRDSGWDVKHMIRTLLLSEAYQQSSVTSPQLRSVDPQNRWLARQGRWRLDAEFVRDTLLQIGGLLTDHRVGGRSVKPYQPAGYWQHLNFPKREWQPSDGENLYRRSLYTFWCRTFLHPAMLAFDATTREECTAERAKSNIPQQALVLLNDPEFVEASRAFADRIQSVDGDPTEQIRWAMREAVSRQPSDAELKVLLTLYEDQLARYQQQPEDAEALLAVGRAEPKFRDRPAASAAWTQVARAIFNLYETTSRF